MDIIQICSLLLLNALQSAPTWSFENHLWDFFNYSISRQACKLNWQVGYVSLPEWIGKMAAQRGRVFMGSVQAQRSMKWSSQKMKLQRASQPCSQACMRLFMGLCTCDGRARQHHIIAGPRRAELLLPTCVWLNSETCTAKN